MLLLSILQPKKLIYMVMFLVFTLAGNVKLDTNETANMEVKNKTQKSVKKDLKVSIIDKAIVEITPPNENDDHPENLVIIDEKSVTENWGNAVKKQETVPKGSENIGILETVTKPISMLPQHYQHPVEEEKFVLDDDDDISESLKAGFYFFFILSSGAIGVIIFKIYRLRLSRAERKYGVQGDRSTQELTPLPISIEDGHSDDEDQTLFEVQRQNIRIL